MNLDDLSPGAVVRGFMAVATLVFGAVGLVVRDPRWFAVSGCSG